MNRNRPPRFVQPIFLLFCLIALQVPQLAAAAEEDVSRNDPQRWYQTDDTPQSHYRNLLVEARAAQQQALEECRSQKGAAAQRCRAEARHNYSADKARAKRILAQLRQR